MNFFKSKKRVLISLLVASIVLLLIGVGVTLYKYPLPILIQNIEHAFLRSGLFEKSTVAVSLDGNIVNVKFNILEKDQEKVSQFVKNADLNPDILKGYSLELDPETADKLTVFLPTEVSLITTPDMITFFSKNQKHLRSGDTSEKTAYSTNEGELILTKNSGNEFKINLKEPAVLLREATSSGKLHLSKNTSGLMIFLQKVATIDMEVNGKNISGEIILK